MKTALSVIAVLTVLLGAATATGAQAVSQLSQVKSVLVVEDGRPIGSLNLPRAGEELQVKVTAGQHQVQVFLQVHAVPGSRMLIITKMGDAVVTALSDKGEVGSGLKGGWSRGDMAVATAEGFQRGRLELSDGYGAGKEKAGELGQTAPYHFREGSKSSNPSTGDWSPTHLSPPLAPDGGITRSGTLPCYRFVALGPGVGVAR